MPWSAKVNPRLPQQSAIIPTKAYMASLSMTQNVPKR
jgi:hypothetical protein